jgi:tripartite-type tricarboxylate transporter receptor subunit TctC
LLIANTGQMTINNAIYPKLPYSMPKDLPLARTALIPLVMVVNNNVPAKNLKEFIAYAKANPGKLNFASGGNGGIASDAGDVQAGIGHVHRSYPVQR